MAASALSSDTVLLYHSIYPEDCLAEACEAYKTFADVSIERGDVFSAIALTPKVQSPDSVTIRREFLNYVLDLSIKKHLAS